MPSVVREQNVALFCSIFQLSFITDTPIPNIQCMNGLNSTLRKQRNQPNRHILVQIKGGRLTHSSSVSFSC